MPHFAPKDIIALVMIVGAFGLRFAGIDHITEWIIVGIGGSYFGVGWVGQARAAISKHNGTATRPEEDTNA